MKVTTKKEIITITLEIPIDECRHLETALVTVAHTNSLSNCDRVLFDKLQHCISEAIYVGR